MKWSSDNRWDEYRTRPHKPKQKKRYLTESEYLVEADRKDVQILDLSPGVADSGFCKYNPLINRYSLDSPENMADTLMFVIATQQISWYDVVSRFPGIVQGAREHGAEFFNNVEGTPSRMLLFGERVKAAKTIWTQREKIFRSLSEPMRDYNRLTGFGKENSVFELYSRVLPLKQFGFPKAGFATQMLVGRLGCIDSINLNLYREQDVAGAIKYAKKDNKPYFASVGTNKKTGELTAGAVTLAKAYAELLKEIGRMLKHPDESAALWDIWVTLVAMKINSPAQILVILPNGKKAVVPNKYSQNKESPSPGGEFRRKHTGKITPHDVSRQHYVPEMYEHKIR